MDSGSSGFAGSRAVRLAFTASYFKFSREAEPRENR